MNHKIKQLLPFGWCISFFEMNQKSGAYTLKHILCDSSLNLLQQKSLCRGGLITKGPGLIPEPLISLQTRGWGCDWLWTGGAGVVQGVATWMQHIYLSFFFPSSLGGPSRRMAPQVIVYITFAKNHPWVSVLKDFYKSRKAAQPTPPTILDLIILRDNLSFSILLIFLKLFILNPNKIQRENGPRSDGQWF